MDDIGNAYRLPCQETNEAPMVVIGSCTYPKVRLSIVASAVNMVSTQLLIGGCRNGTAVELSVPSMVPSGQLAVDKLAWAKYECPYPSNMPYLPEGHDDEEDVPMYMDDVQLSGRREFFERICQTLQMT